MEVKPINAGEYVFECRISGDQKNEAILLLHGFPETSFMWKPLMEKLSSLGYFCTAPNLRGYSENACPRGKQKYHMTALSEDVLNIADAFGKKKFHLIGHDWGAMIGWNVVFNNSSRINSWTALSVPHPRGFVKAIKTDKTQKKKVRYMAWFLLPLLPEIMLRKKDFEKFRRLWKNSTEKEVEDYLAVFRRKGALTAALNYYRANLGGGKKPNVGNIESPTLFIWGKKDLAVGSIAAGNNEKYMKGDYTFLALDGGHWLIQTNYAEVENAVIDHLQNNV